MKWLKELSPLVAVVVLYVWAMRHDKKSTVDTIKMLSDCFVKPLQEGIQESLGSMRVIVQNHFQHDLEERLADREERREMRKAIQELTQQVKIANHNNKT